MLTKFLFVFFIIYEIYFLRNGFIKYKDCKIFLLVVGVIWILIKSLFDV